MDAETSEQMMDATYRALCEHGYADLTMQRIADESSVSKATFHYHFDTKEELLNAFLDHLIEEFERRLACEASDPRERLDAFLDAIFTPAEDTDVSPIPLMELKSQAPYHDAYRERFVEMDDRLREVVATAVRDGIESGQFDDADPEEVAQFIVTAINGAHIREVALGEDPNETRRLVEEYLERRLGYTSEVVA
ncbi:TetR/AcrR family transcriptional regulator [Halorussus limi]|uniref:TetR/AcrR family transcriptional regulator n=1 Tax=Halorussus limi TaxID=2938695 RepID=A0A8U0HTV1_9EURY|nr:TetR/AcrR family transcriptional regulator [Halorussus limi]UPV74485.1 TetR/AcrR family transcriptional regulator [Halorussus limi]